MKIQNNSESKTISNFKGRKVAIAKPLINGVNQQIDIYRIGKKDIEFFSKLNSSIDMEKLYPAKKNAHCFEFWKDIIDVVSHELGNRNKQKAYLAVKDNKPFGVLVSSVNKDKANVDLFATWPIEVNTTVKAGGSTLFSAFLDILNRKRGIKKVSLEPVINGPTDAVGFYKRHGFDFLDTKSTKMGINTRDLKKVVQKKSSELNIVPLKKTNEHNMMDFLDC